MSLLQTASPTVIHTKNWQFSQSWACPSSSHLPVWFYKGLLLQSGSLPTQTSQHSHWDLRTLVTWIDKGTKKKTAGTMQEAKDLYLCAAWSALTQDVHIHAGVYTRTGASERALPGPVKVSVQCRSSSHEWLIKGDTVVFSGNGGGGNVPLLYHRAMANTQQELFCCYQRRGRKATIYN